MAHRLLRRPALALAILVGAWTLAFAALLVWDQTALAKMGRQGSVRDADLGAHLSSELQVELALWALGAAGLVASFGWFRRLDRDRERAVAASLKSAADLQALVSSIDDVVFGITADDRFECLSNARTFERVLAHPREIDGQPYTEVLSRDAADKLRGALAALAASGEPQEADYVQDRGGQLNYWNARVSQRCAPDGTSRGALVVVRDTMRRGQRGVALQDMEERWRLVYENSGEGILLSRPDGTYLAANRAACEIFGLSESEFAQVGRGVVTDTSRKQLMALIAQREQRGFVRGELQVRRKDGVVVDVEGSSTLTQLSDGQYRVVTVFRDVTARKQAEAAARESALRWQAAMDAVGDGLWDWNLETDEAFFSATAIGMLGYAPDEIPPRMDEWRRRIHPEDVAATMAVLEQHLGGKIPINETQHRLLCQDGTYKWLLARGRVVARAADGRPLRMIGTVKDLTEIRQAQQRLLENEERYRHLFNNTSDAIIAFPVDPGGQVGHIAEANEAAWRLVGCTRDELLARTAFDLEVPERQATLPARIAALQRDGRMLFETEVVTKDGVRVPLEVHAQLFQRQGRPWVLSAMRDLTARRTAESEIARLAHERAVLLDTLPVGVCLLKNRKVQWVNRAIEQALGYPPGTLVGLDTEKLYATAEGYRRVGQEGYPVIARGEVFEIEVEFARHDGTGVWGRMSGRALNPANLAEGTIWAIADITERRRAEQAVRASEARLASTIAAIADLILILDRDGRFRECHRPPSHPLLLPESAFLGKKFSEVLPPPVAEQLAESLRALSIAGEVQSFDYELPVDGEPYWWTASVSARKGADGGPDGAVVVVRDMSDRKRAEHALRESEEKFFRTFQHAPVAIAMLDYPSGRVLEANTFALTTSGYRPETELGRTLVEIGWMTPRNLVKIWRRLRTDGVVRDFEIEGRTKAGVVLHGLVNCQVVTIGGNQRVLLSFMDITARRKAETAVEAGRRELDLFFNQSLVGFFFSLVDKPFFWNDTIDKEAALDHMAAHRRIARANAALLAQYGGTAEQVLNQPAGALFAGHRPAIRGFWRRLFDAGHLHAETDEVKLDGTPMMVEGDYTCLYDTEGRITGFFGVQRDVTERMRAEEGLRQSEDRFRQVSMASSDFVYSCTEDEDGSQSLDWMAGAVEQITLCTPAELQKERCWRFLVVEEDLPLFRQNVADLRPGETGSCELRLRRADGSTIWVASRARCVPDSIRPERRRLHGALVDITARRQAEAAVSESRETYHGIINSVTEAIYVHDEHGVFLDVNEGALRMYGLSREELIGRTPADVSAPGMNDLAAVGAQGARVFHTGQPATFEFWGRRKNGEIFPKACVTLRGKFFGRDVLITTARDITALKVAEKELRMLLRAVEQSPVIVLITDRTGRIEYANPGFTAVTGYTLEETIGQNPRVLKSGEHSDAFYREMWASLAAGKEWRGEFHNRKKNGELYWEATTISPIHDDAGVVTHYLAIKEDVTAAKRDAERIRHQAALLDAAQDAIIEVNLERQVTFWNRGAAKLYGLAAEEARGRRYEDVVYQKVPADFATEWQRLLDLGHLFVERRHNRKDGGEIVVQARATVVAGAAGRPRAVLLIITDVSEAKRLEAQYLRAQRMESLGSLASGVAHDLNNVLTPILVATDMLRSLARTPHDKEVVQLVGDSARRGAEIVQQLLLYGRGSDTPRTTVDPGAVVRELGRMLKETFPKNIALHVQAPKGIWPVEADRTQLHQVLLNLCVNARDAMPRGGRLDVVAENVHVDEAFAQQYDGAKPGPHVVVRVTDTGTGIPRAVLEKIFDPFFTTKPLGKGTGLGLATVLGITRSHGGFVVVETQEGYGSTFGIFLPALLSPALTTASEERRQAMVGRSELVLLVDDEPAVRSVLERALLHAQYRVVTAANGAEALALFARHAGTVDMVVTDMMMPIMDGMQLIHALRRLEPALPVVAMSGLAETRLELEQTVGSHFRFIPKPFMIDAVLKAARELIDEAQSRRKPR